jgi:phage pi2 protein 07
MMFIICLIPDNNYYIDKIEYRQLTLKLYDVIRKCSTGQIKKVRGPPVAHPWYRAIKYEIGKIHVIK